jgi:hypothetical protein
MYVSVAFLAWALYRADYLKLPHVVSPAMLVCSFAFLCCGFLCHALSWHKTLQAGGAPVAYTTALAGTGLSVFGKYVPGKVWLVLGRAGYAGSHSVHGTKKLAALSVNAQVLALWVGLIIGGLGLCLTGGRLMWGMMAIALWVGLSLVLFTRWLHGAAEKLASYLLRRTISIPSLDVGSVLRISPWFGLYWLLWSVSFYFLVAALSAGTSPVSGFAFPLASTLGILAVIAPGGLGVREGVITAYLTLNGHSPAEAAGISVASRLWFLIGEVFIFFAGLVASRWVADKERPDEIDEIDQAGKIETSRKGHCSH